jgi:hypothetical protein
MGQITFSFVDKSGERGSVNLPVPDLALANIETYTDGGTAFNALEAAVAALTLLTATGNTVTAESAGVAAPVLPTDDNAQRERVLLFFLSDTNGHKTRIGIPGIDLTGIAQSGTDDVPLDATTEVEDMVTAIETYCVDSITGNAVTVYRIRHVGRNN